MYTAVGGSRSNSIITSCITVDRDPISGNIHIVWWIAVQFCDQTWCVLDRDPTATMRTSVGGPRYIVSIITHRSVDHDPIAGYIHEDRWITIQSCYQIRHVLDRDPNLAMYTAVGSRSNFIITSCITVDRDPIYGHIHVVRWIAVQF